jgi:hypothetical protein
MEEVEERDESFKWTSDEDQEDPKYRTLESLKTMKDIPKVSDEDRKKIDQLKTKRTKKWKYYRSLHAKSTNEIQFVVNEKVFLQ